MRSETQFLIAWLVFSSATPAEDRQLPLATRVDSEPLTTGKDAATDATENDRSHWQRGEVRIGGEWIHYPQVGNLDARKALLARYRELRSDRGSSLDDQLNLANECRKLQLVDEERAHLEQVVRQDRNHAAAHERLGDRLIEGDWYTPRDQLQLQARLADLASAENRFGKEIREAAKQFNGTNLRRHQAAEKVLLEIHDPAAIPVMEQAFAFGTEAAQLRYLSWLDRLPSWKSSAALAKLSLMSESPRVRVETANSLRERPWEEFVPVYLSEFLLTDIKTEIVRRGPWAQLTMVTTSESGDSRRMKIVVSRFVPPIIHFTSRRWGFTRVSIPHPALNTIQSGVRELETLALQEVDHVSQRNRDQISRNDRACGLLSSSLGIVGLDSPAQWWRWWDFSQGYTDTEKHLILTNYEENWYISHRGSKSQVAGPMILRRVGSCFVAGTRIQTESGLAPIESIQIGDRVLSQDVETGELAYKPVLRTTVRESKDTRRIRSGSDELQCSPGHPFWVNGHGWVQAQDLTEKSQLHTIQDSAEVTSVTEDLAATVHNLEVADFNTYFVGHSHILSHDVTVRDPSDMVEPGVLKPELAAFAAK